VTPENRPTRIAEEKGGGDARIDLTTELEGMNGREPAHRRERGGAEIIDAQTGGGETNGGAGASDFRQKYGVTGAGKNKSRVLASAMKVSCTCSCCIRIRNEKVFAGNDEFAVSVGNDAEIF